MALGFGISRAYGIEAAAEAAGLLTHGDGQAQQRAVGYRFQVRMLEHDEAVAVIHRLYTQRMAANGLALRDGALVERDALWQREVELQGSNVRHAAGTHHQLCQSARRRLNGSNAERLCRCSTGYRQQRNYGL